MYKLITYLAVFVFAGQSFCRTNIRPDFAHALDKRIPAKAISLGNLLAREETTTVIVPVSCTKTTFVTHVETAITQGTYTTAVGPASAATTAVQSNPSNSTTPTQPPASFVTQTLTPTSAHPASAATTAGSFANTAAPSSSAILTATDAGGSGAGAGGGVGSAQSSGTPTPTPSTVIPPQTNVAVELRHSNIILGMGVLMACSFLVGA